MALLLEGERVVLRCVERRDVPDIVTMLNDWEVSQWLSVPPFPYTEENGLRFCEMAKTNHALACPTLFAVALRAGDRIVGSIEVQADAAGDCGVGYWIGKQHWRKGYAGEALALAERHTVARLMTRRLFAVLDTDNLASRGCSNGPASRTRRPWASTTRPDAAARNSTASANQLVERQHRTAVFLPCPVSVNPAPVLWRTPYPVRFRLTWRPASRL